MIGTIDSMVVVKPESAVHSGTKLQYPSDTLALPLRQDMHLSGQLRKMRKGICYCAAIAKHFIELSCQSSRWVWDLVPILRPTISKHGVGRVFEHLKAVVDIIVAQVL